MIHMFRRRRSKRSLPEGQRIYAVGDVHGRLDLLDQLLAQIHDDNRTRGPREAQLVLLGDLIDRGPHSAEVLRRVMQLSLPGIGVVALKGNHEMIMLDALDGDRGKLSLWLAHGGSSALRSWGVSSQFLHSASLDEIVLAARSVISPEERKWLSRLPVMHRAGDYLFVHAGIRPGIPLDRQRDQDLVWIRDEFLSSTVNHGFTVIHGHSVRTEVDEQPHRIGIDTGAYATGTLTAIGLEDSDRWFLAATASIKALVSAERHRLTA